MTAQDLKSRSLKDLAVLAKRYGVSGWHAMNKNSLVAALARALRRKAALAAKGHKSKHADGRNALRSAGNGHVVASARSAKKPTKTASRNGSHGAHSNGAQRNGTHRNGAAHRNRSHRNGSHANGALRNAASGAKAAAAARASQRIRQLQLSEDRRKNLATAGGNGRSRDRLVALVRDPFWLQANWELSRQSIERARVAMGQDWHTARPVLRLLEVCGGEGTSTVERLVRDIPIHGGVSNWYVDVKDPPKSFRLDIGYLSASRRFFSLARSNVVSTPRAGTSDALDNNWNDVAANFDKIYAMNGGASEHGADEELEELFEERLRRPLNSSALTQFVAQVNGHKHPKFNFEIDAELIVFGNTEPDAQVTLHGAPIEVRPDGSFTVRYSLPNCRQVIPAVARSSDGLEQRTIVLAVERNTKSMEPVLREGGE